MKKTIITALLSLGLAAAACGADAYTSLLYNSTNKNLGTAISDSASDIDVSETLTNKAFAYTLFFNVEKLETLLTDTSSGTVTLATVTNTSTNAAITNAWTLVASSSGFQLQSTSTSLSQAVAGPSSWDNLTEIALTVAYSGNVTSMDLTTAVTSGNTTTYSTTNGYAKASNGNDWKWSGSYTPSSISLNTEYVDAAYVRSQTSGGLHSEGLRRTYGNDLMTAYDTAASVPEPATATLSLLALAGLAARRRRK